MQQRGILGAALLTALVVALFGGTALAATVSLASSSGQVEVGDTFEVEVHLAGVAEIDGVELRLQFDPAMLEATSVQVGSLVSGGMVGKKDTDNQAGTVDLAVGLGSSVTVTPDNSVVARVAFRAVQAGTAMISLAASMVVTPDLQIEPVTGEGQQVTITGPAGGSGGSGNPGGDASGSGTPVSNTGGSESSGQSASSPAGGEATQQLVDGKPSAGGQTDAQPQRAGWRPKDVSPGHWASQTIDNLVDRGLVGGYEDGTFRPEQEITRAEFLALVLRTLDGEAGSGPLPFSDAGAIPPWAQGVAASAYARGLVQGDEQGRFRANAPITRAEIAAIVTRALGREEEAAGMAGDAPAFSDGAQAAWASAYLAWGKMSGLITGYTDGTFKPLNRATRAEAAALIERMLGRLQ